jgi:CrcB protein
MGLFVGWMTDRSPLYPELRLLFAVGFLGSYTTFSSYILDASNLARSGAWAMSLAYGFGSFALGWLGLELGRWLIDRWR